MLSGIAASALAAAPIVTASPLTMPNTSIPLTADREAARSKAVTVMVTAIWAICGGGVVTVMDGLGNAIAATADERPWLSRKLEGPLHWAAFFTAALRQWVELPSL